MKRNGLKTVAGIVFCLSLSGCGSTAKTESAPVIQSNPTVATTSDLKQTQRDKIAATYNVQMGMGYLQQGNNTQAKTKLMTALKLSPKDPVVLDAVAYYYETVGENNLASKYYKKALAAAPHNGSVLNNYGTFLCRQGQLQASMGYFMKAVKDQNYNDSAGAYENAGLCSLQMPNIAQAEQYFHAALRFDPKRSTSLYELAQLSYDQGQYPQANQYFQKYTQVGPQSADALWLGIQIAQKLGDKKAMVSYASLLQNKFPTSLQYKQYLAQQSRVS